MQISITGNLDTGISLQNYVEEKLTKEVNKYFDSAISAHVYFKKQNQKKDGHHPINHVTISINEGSKRHVAIKSDAEGTDIYVTFDLALDKIVKQLRRYKKRLQDFGRHKRDDDLSKVIQAQKYVLPSEMAEKYEVVEEDRDRLHVIKEKEVRVEELTVNEAIMKMDLAYLPALVFINKDNGRINVVYHRKDGNISWVDPKNI